MAVAYLISTPQSDLAFIKVVIKFAVLYFNNYKSTFSYAL